MCKLAKTIECPDHFYYLLEFVHPNLVALQQLYCRFPDLAGSWPDISEYTADDLDEIDELLTTLRLVPSVSTYTKSVPDDDDAA